MIQFFTSCLVQLLEIKSLSIRLCVARLLTASLSLIYALLKQIYAEEVMMSIMLMKKFLTILRNKHPWTHPWGYILCIGFQKKVHIPKSSGYFVINTEFYIFVPKYYYYSQNRRDIFKQKTSVSFLTYFMTYVRSKCCPSKFFSTVTWDFVISEFASHRYKIGLCVEKDEKVCACILVWCVEALWRYALYVVHPLWS
jgi:hypothetical protein